MCCFSQRIEQVSGTSIFARGTNGHQILVYSMKYAARSELAMVLPLPVPPASPEDAVEFIDLAGYPEFFDDLEGAFYARGPVTAAYGGLCSLSAPYRPPLVVHNVGAFEASFVPCLEDFMRLDPRFRIPRTVWDEIPIYSDYGFAVFKLKATLGNRFARLVHPKRQPVSRRVHPMALKFPRRNPELLYFPTLHIHDQTVQSAADFDHVLYCQPEPGWDHFIHLRNWSWSFQPAREHLDLSKAQELIDPSAHCFRYPLAGRRQNRDTWVAINATYPEAVAV